MVAQQVAGERFIQRPQARRVERFAIVRAENKALAEAESVEPAAQRINEFRRSFGQDVRFYDVQPQDFMAETFEAQCPVEEDPDVPAIGIGQRVGCGKNNAHGRQVS